jgi:hypothetical protein
MNLFSLPRLRFLVLSLAVAGAGAVLPATEPVTTVWKIDRTDAIAGQSVEKLGDPRVVDTPKGPAVSFAGGQDGLLLSGPSPLSGATQYTIEALVFVAGSEQEEKQKIIHIQDEKGTRVIIELTQYPGGVWAFEGGSKAYLDEKPVETYITIKGRRYPAGQWFWLALTYDGKQMSAYINGEFFLAKPVDTLPLKSACVTGIGVRATKRDSFRGKIREIRLTPAVLPVANLQHQP